MAQKRKDLKNRVLNTGESQIKKGQFRGRYQYDYVDSLGNRKHVNSWRLVESDPLPAGHRPCKPLRTLEREIIESSVNGVNYAAGSSATLEDAYERYMKIKQGIKETTRVRYVSIWNSLIKPRIGNCKLKSLKYSDIKGFYADLLKEGYSIATCDNCNTIIHPILEMCVNDDIIRKNPSKGAMTDLKKFYNNPEPRHALTRTEQTHFLNFCKSSKYIGYYSMFVFIIGTGCRIGEVLSLTWKDVDFEGGYISINKNLGYWKHSDGAYRAGILKPKTESGCRSIPMLTDVRHELEVLKEASRYRDTSYTIDGISNFVFLDRSDTPYTKESINQAIKRILRDYNDMESKKAIAESREPELIRPFSCHNLRHTFITRCIEGNMNPKALQVIAGHADIQTTLNIYASCSKEMRKDALTSIDDFLKLSYNESDL